MTDISLAEKIAAVEYVAKWIDEAHDDLRPVLQAVLADLRDSELFEKTTFQAGRILGETAMRERAAQYLDNSAEKHEAAAKRYNLTRSDTLAEQQRKDARAIRALPVE